MCLISDEGDLLPLQLHLENPRDYFDGHHTTSLCVNADVSKPVAKGKEERVRFFLYGGKSLYSSEDRRQKTKKKLPLHLPFRHEI